MIEALLVLAALLVTFSNGANDNFKGFATVWGSDTLSYRQALGLATLATVAGSLTSLWLANGLVQSFSGKGLVPDAVVLAPAFLTAVALGAAGTVLLATRLGFPVSTTHALIGALIGAGLAQAGADVHWVALASAFMAPLLLSPLLAVALSVAAHRLFAPRRAQPDCACVVLPEPVPQPGAHGVATARAALPQLVIASNAVCAPFDAPLRVSVPRSLDRLHVLSAMSICYARGVNDTPKLAALLLAAQVWNAQVSLLVLAAVMAAGGLLFSRRVAQTMSQRVTRMGHREPPVPVWLELHTAMNRGCGCGRRSLNGDHLRAIATMAGLTNHHAPACSSPCGAQHRRGRLGGGCCWQSRRKYSPLPNPPLRLQRKGGSLRCAPPVALQREPETVHGEA